MSDTRKRTTRRYDDLTFGELLATAAEEAAAIASGVAPAAKVSRVPVTARQATVTPPPKYQAKRIRAVRRRLGLSQSVFARALNVSLGTVRGWEQGVRLPEGPSRRLLQMAEQHPTVVLASLARRRHAS